MNTQKRTRKSLVVAIAPLILAITLFLPTNILAQPPGPGEFGPPPDASAEPQGYDSPAIGRLSEVIDDTFILGKDDVDWSYAEPNLIVEEGDLLQTSQTGMAELQFQGDETFRVGENSQIAIIELDNNKVIGIDNGKGYLRVTRLAPSNAAFIVTFPNGQLTATEPALVRFDVFQDGGSGIKIIRGAADIETAAESPRTFRGGEQVLISLNGRIEFARFDPAPKDDFDNWNRDRDIALSTYNPPSYIGGDIVGAQDLEGYGDWVYANDYDTYVWRPYVVSDWRPYEYGHWYYSPVYGWTWVPAEPWGYATYHYGSWNYDPSFGWVWAPGRVWRPSFVRWVVYGSYVGWVPLGRHGHVVITTYPYHITNVNVIHVDKRSFIFVNRSDFESHRYYTRRDKILAADIGKIPPGKVRLVKDLKGAGIVRTPRKGMVVRERIAYNKIVDVKKHPDLSRKIERLEKYERVSKPGAPVISTLPKRTKADVMKAYDFRQQVKEKRVIEKNKWKSAEQWKQGISEKGAIRPAAEKGPSEKEQRVKERALGEPRKEPVPPTTGEEKKLRGIPQRQLGPGATESQPTKEREKLRTVPSRIEARPEEKVKSERQQPEMGPKGANEPIVGPQREREMMQERPTRTKERVRSVPTLPSTRQEEVTIPERGQREKSVKPAPEAVTQPVTETGKQQPTRGRENLRSAPSWAPRSKQETPEMEPAGRGRSKMEPKQAPESSGSRRSKVKAKERVTPPKEQPAPEEKASGNNEERPQQLRKDRNNRSSDSSKVDTRERFSWRLPQRQTQARETPQFNRQADIRTRTQKSTAAHSSAAKKDLRANKAKRSNDSRSALAEQSNKQGKRSLKNSSLSRSDRS